MKTKLDHLSYLNLQTIKPHLDEPDTRFSLAWKSGMQAQVSVTRDGVELNYFFGGRHHAQQISIASTPCHYGYTRPWLLCPSCGGRCTKLFLRGEFKCRKCTRLCYRTQSMRPDRRAMRTATKLHAKLDPSGGEVLDTPPRPPRMHRATYRRLKKQIQHNLEIRYSAEGSKLLRVLRRMQAYAGG